MKMAFDTVVVVVRVVHFSTALDFSVIGRTHETVSVCVKVLSGTVVQISRRLIVFASIVQEILEVRNRIEQGIWTKAFSVSDVALSVREFDIFQRENGKDNIFEGNRVHHIVHKIS